MNLIKTIFSVIFLSVAQGLELQFSQVKLKGACPRISYATNVDMSRVIGWYYRVFSNFNNPLCYKNEGQTMYTAQYNATYTTVNICCRSASDPDVAICGTDIGSGYAVAIAENPGEFRYEYVDDVYPAYVLDTDYENYFVTYKCKPGSQSNQRDEELHIYSRDYTLDKTYEDRVRNVLQRNDIEWSVARPIKQGPMTPYTLFAKNCYSTKI